MNILVKTQKEGRKLKLTYWTVSIIILDSLRQTKRAFQCYTTILYLILHLPENLNGEIS